MSNNGTLVRNLIRGGSGGGANSNIPFSIKSANIGDKGEVDLFNITQIVNNGCSFTGLIATGGENKHLRLLETAPLSSATSWEIQIGNVDGGYVYNGGGTTGQIILSPSTSKNFSSPFLSVELGKFIIFISSNGSSWDIANAVDTGVAAVTSTNYRFKLIYDSTTGYDLQYSTDGTNYSSMWSSATTTATYCASPFMFLNSYLDPSYHSNGTLNVAGIKITINGVVWYDGANIGNSLSFKVDDGTSYAPLKVINPSGEEVTLTTISALDLSGFADGIINIFATATGAVARQNNIYMQTEEPVAENDGDVWINGNVVKDWDDSESEYVTSTTIAFLGSVVKNKVIENGFNPPLNYNGQIEMSCFNYVSGNLEIDIIAKSGFKFFGRYKNYLLGSSGTYKYPTLFFAFYDTSYCGIYAGGTTDLDYASYVSSVARDIFGYYSNNTKFGYVILQGYITI